MTHSYRITIKEVTSGKWLKFSVNFLYCSLKTRTFSWSNKHTSLTNERLPMISQSLSSMRCPINSLTLINFFQSCEQNLIEFVFFLLLKETVWKKERSYHSHQQPFCWCCFYVHHQVCVIKRYVYSMSLSMYEESFNWEYYIKCSCFSPSLCSILTCSFSVITDVKPGNTSSCIL